MALVMGVGMTACGQTESTTTSQNETAAEVPAETTGEEIPITLTIGDTVLDAYLYNTVPGQSLAEQLPLTVTLNDSDNDFCGGNIDLTYSENDVTSGYQNGDLAFWTPSHNFVLFVSGNEDAVDTDDIVRLGRVTSAQEELDALEGRIDVTIALKETGTNTDSEEGPENMEIKMTVGNQTLYGTLENNATTRAWVKEMPMTLPMRDLYGREMCHRYGNGALPTDNLRSDQYAVGDIAYWPPMGSLVILYAQNGERFERQHLGHINSGVDIFESTGDTNVTFELV